MRNTILANGRKWMVGMVAAAGLLTAGTVAAKAQNGYQGQYPAQQQYPDQGQYQGQYEDHGQYSDQGQDQGQYGYDTAAIPPCPGDGYVWTVGYYNGGYWVPGAWVFRGAGYRVYPGWNRGYAYGYGRGYRPEVRFDHRGGGFERRGFEQHGFEQRGFEQRGFSGRSQNFGHEGGRGFDGRGQGGGMQSRGFEGRSGGFQGGHGGHR